VRQQKGKRSGTKRRLSINFGVIFVSYGNNKEGIGKMIVKFFDEPKGMNQVEMVTSFC
jgi:hypothetical protein